jgi:hypothetical protein
MIEVQVTVDDNMNVFRRDAGGAEILQQLGRHAVALSYPLRQFVPDPSFNQDGVPAGAHHYGIQPDAHAILFIGSYFLPPQDLGNSTEQGSAVNVVAAVRDGNEFEIAHQ